MEFLSYVDIAKITIQCIKVDLQIDLNHQHLPFSMTGGPPVHLHFLLQQIDFLLDPQRST